MAVAILFAGIAQAAHYHKDKQGHFSGADLHCLLCQYAGGTAALPVLPAPPPAPPPYRDYQPPLSVAFPDSSYVGSYDARGPPSV